MSFCCRCRHKLTVTLAEFVDRNAWCPRCRQLVSVSLCKVPSWVLAIVAILSMHVRIMAIR